MALSDILLNAETTFQDVSFYLNKVVVVLVIILFGFIIGKIAESILRRLFVQLDVDERLTRMFKARRNYARAIRRTIVRIIYVLTILVALDRLAVLEEAYAVLLFLVAVTALISIVLAGTDVVPNIIARSSLAKRKIKVGQEISLAHPTGFIQGVIVDMTLTDVRMKRRNGDLFFIPNAVFLEAIVRKRAKGL